MNTEPRTRAFPFPRGLAIAAVLLFALASFAGGFHSLPHNIVYYGLPIGIGALVLWLIPRK